MDKINAVNFKGLFYAKSAIFASEIQQGVKPYLLDQFPNKLLKDIVESSPIFNDLKNKTDVYISSYISKDDIFSTGYLRAIFKDPYSKKSNRIDSINLEAIGDNEAIIFEKLRNIANKLPIYKAFNKHKTLPLQRIFLGENGSDGFIQKNLKF